MLSVFFLVNALQDGRHERRDLLRHGPVCRKKPTKTKRIVLYTNPFQSIFFDSVRTENYPVDFIVIGFYYYLIIIKIVFFF